MSNKLQIGEKEYQLPLKVVCGNNSDYLEDVNDELVLRVGWEDGEKLQIIADSLNARARGGWIPVSERMPKANDTVILTYEFRNYPTVIKVGFGCYGEDGRWRMNYRLVAKQIHVIAWRPLPDAFVPDTEEEEK